jgi:hypothetical protein
MRTAMPPMTESADALQPRRQRDHDGPTKPRLQRWDRLARRQAPTRQAVAPRRGSQRQTIGRGLARDAAGGLAALLATASPAGPPVSRTPAGRARLEQVLRRPAGFAASEARRPGVRRTPGVEVKATTLSTSVRPRFTAQRNVARPRHPQQS